MENRYKEVYNRASDKITVLLLLAIKIVIGAAMIGALIKFSIKFIFGTN